MRVAALARGGHRALDGRAPARVSQAQRGRLRLLEQRIGLGDDDIAAAQIAVFLRFLGAHAVFGLRDREHQLVDLLDDTRHLPVLQALRRPEEKLGAAAARGDETDAHFHKSGVELLMRHDAAGVEHQLGAAAESLSLRSHDDGFFEVFQPEIGLLEVLHALLQHVELPGFNGGGHLVKIGSRAEVCSRVADDHRLEGLASFDLLGRREHQLRGVDRVGIGLRSEREERHAVSEVTERRVAVLHDHAPAVCQLKIRRGLFRRAGVEAAVACDLFLRPGGHVESLRLHQGQDLFRAKQIAELEGPFDPVVAAAHGRVDVAEIIADLVRGLHRQPHRLEHDAPQEGRLGIISEEQTAQPLLFVAQLRERGDLHPLERDVLRALVIPDEALRALRPLRLAVEARAGLVAEISPLRDVIERLRPVAEGLFVVRDIGPGHVFHRVHADVQSDEVEQLEGALLGPEDQIAGQRVRLRKAVAAVRRRVHDRGQRHRADAVGDKAGRVLAADRRLAEAVVDERADALNDLLPGLRVRDELDKVHVAYGVEKVDAEEAALPLLLHPLGDRGDRDVRGVRADDRLIRGVVEDELRGALLDREVFRHGLDHQVAVRKQRGVLQHVRAYDAGADTRLVRALHLAALEDVCHGFLRAVSAALLRFSADHQDHVQPRAGPAGGDGRAHGPGADDRQFSDALSHICSFPCTDRSFDHSAVRSLAAPVRALRRRSSAKSGPTSISSIAYSFFYFKMLLCSFTIAPRFSPIILLRFCATWCILALK